MKHTCSNSNGSIGCEQCWQDIQEELAVAKRKNGGLLRALHNTRLAYCQAACKNYPIADPRQSEHTEFCTEISGFIMNDGEVKA